jgi:predicted PurR-regulated permease PerM
MNKHPLTLKHWQMVALASIALGLFFVMPYIGVIALAALVAFLFHGVYRRLNRKFSPSLSAVLTVIFSLLVIIVPLTAVTIFTAAQLTQLASDMSSTITAESQVSSNISAIVMTVNSIVASFGGTDQILSTAGILDFLRTTLPALLRGAAMVATQVLGSIPLAVALSITYVTLLYEFLRYGSQIVAHVVALSPFQPKITRLYLDRIGMMANAMAKGQLYISLIISLLSVGILALCLGMTDYWFLMLVVFTLLNLVPLGCGIVVIPITIVAMISGAFWPGLAALVLYIIVSNLDAVIRPRIVPRSITLSPGLTMLAAFGGLTFFGGILGVVYGPMLMIAVVTSVQIYLEEYNTPYRRSRTA